MKRGDLKQYGKNLYSQNGEDGILEEILRRMGITDGWFVEFGAWDGRHLSNAFHLLSDVGWRGVFIEGDKGKYEALLKTAEAFPDRLHTICAMVGFEGEQTLDRLLATVPIPKEFELLSIDIDSYDWEVWEALKDYRPKIVVIESNPAISPGVVSTHNPPKSLYASFSALVQLGQSKGYELVCHNGNCFFVLKELTPTLGLDPEFLKSPEKLFDYSKCYKERAINLLRKWLPEHWMHTVFNFLGDLREARKKARREGGVPTAR